MKKPLKKQTPKKEVRVAPDWKIETSPVQYDRALAFMEAKATLIAEKSEKDFVWLLEHPPVYTAGTSADKKDLINPRFPVAQAGRGGQYTYHGPGQRVAYVMMDLNKRVPDLRKYVHDLEEWVIRTLTPFGVKGERRAGRVGIWVNLKPYGRKGEAKIAAIGVRVRKWVTWHGVSINVNPDLSHYDGIVPCGISTHGVTSLDDLGIKVSMAELDKSLRQSFIDVFGS